MRGAAITRSDHRFSRREVREHAGWSDFQVRMHMHKLEELEYVLVHRGGRGQIFVYELLYDGRVATASPLLMGLIDVETLNRAYDGEEGASETATWSIQVAPMGHP